MDVADDRVLAVMMKAPRPGRVKTRLGSVYSADRILELYRALVEDTIALARGMHVRTVAVCPAADEVDLRAWLPRGVEVTPQNGQGLAAGLHSTFDQLCDESRPRVIAFNADSPHLAAGVLDAAFAALATHDIVVGPCDDGGYYLVGARRPYDGLFDPTKMGGESACAALLAEADRRGLRVALSAEHYDVDVPDDLLRLAIDLTRDCSRATRTAELLMSWGLIRSAAGG